MEISSKTEQWLGTKIEIKLPSQFDSIFPECFSEIRRIEGAYSRFIEDSALSKANKSLGKWQDAPEEFIGLLLMAKKFHEKTEGNFDITLKSALDSMGYDKEYSFRPRHEKMVEEANCKLQFDEAVKIDGKKGRILLRKEIDFGGFGKGYALDRVAGLLGKKGISHYYINAGGDIYAKAGKGLRPWKIILEHPDDPAMAMGEIEIDGCAIAGTSPNRRKWGDFHHLLSAKTRMPVQGCKAIFVKAKTGAEADSYAKGIFCAGFEKGIMISKKLPVEILFVSESDKMYSSPGFNAKIYK